MKKYVYIITLVAFGVASCTQSKDVIPSSIKSGDDVLFSASMSASTRTTYGELGSSSRPVYWKDGDMITVASPQCMEGRNVAEYKINTEGAENINYAKSIDKTGAYGVQWGDTEPADCKFYAVYPSSEILFNGSSVAANMTIASTQTVTLQRKGAQNAYEPVYDNMVNNIMYAQPLAGKTQITVDEETGKTTANLQFQPYSTVLHINMDGWKYKEGGEITSGEQNMVVYSVTINSGNSTPLSGDFSLTMNESGATPTIGGLTNTSNSITVEFKTKTEGGELNGVDLAPNEALNFDIFLIPSTGVSIDGNWTIAVNTSAGKWSKKLDVKNTTSTTLTAGSIHKLPNLPSIEVDNTWNFDTKQWIKDINNNVYFTEISLPGSWYSYSNTTDNSTASDIYQTSGISEQFDAGIRSFYIETKVGRTYDRWLIKPSKETSTVVVSGTGVAWRDGDALTSSSINNNKARSINSAIIAIANKVKNTNEFAVLTLAFADGGTFGVNATWRSYWIEKIKDVLAETEVANALNGVLYTDEITPETTVEQLRGRLILKINIDEMYEGAEYQNVADSEFEAIPALFSYTTYNWVNSSNVSTIKWKGKPTIENTTINKESTNFYWNYTVANRTYSNTDTPTLADRKTSISQIIENSYSAHNEGKNNLWGMVGAGGSMFSSKGESGGNAREVSDGDNGLNAHLTNVINAKVNEGKASPMGMVFINFATEEKGKALIEAIIRMNNRFELGKKQKGTESGNTPTPVQSAKAGYSSGFNVDTENWNAF